MQNTTTKNNFQVKISSKNQVTLPVLLLKQMGWSSGQVFTVTSNPQKKEITLNNQNDNIDKIRTRLQKFRKKDMTPDEAIEKAHTQKQKERFDYED
jgi:bifunctional DNA-binding transcriptional regulator/antitoxin component of YhaV-PrlF toxin-antitoxin module